MTTLKEPVQPQSRLEFVDIIRGFALFGVLAANMASFSGYSLNTAQYTDFLDVAILIAIQFFIRAKFYSLFSFLFGWGMSIQMRRSSEKGTRFGPLFARRLAILLVFGLIHGLVIWSGDILTLYALLGFALLLFRSRSERTIWISAVLFLLLQIILNLPTELLANFRDWYAEATSFLRQGNLSNSVLADGGFWIIIRKTTQDFLAANSWFIYYVGGVFSMFLLGLYAGKRRIFQNVENHLSLLHWTMIAGLIIGVLFNGIYVVNTVYSDWISPDYNRFVGVASRTVGAPALMLFYVSGLTLLMRREVWLERLRPLGNVGRMALSNYLLQSVVCVLIFYGYGLGLYGKTDPTFGFIITLLLFSAQIHLSRQFLEKHPFGPMEWLWRTLTYGRLQPWRKKDTGSGAASIPDLPAFRRLPAAIKAALVLIPLCIIAASLFLTLRQSEAVQEISQAVIPPEPVETVPGILDNQNHRPISTPQPIATPHVEPAFYNPQPALRRGDMSDLVGSFSAEQALQQITILSGPTYDGRRAGSAGGLAAGDYLAAQFESLGLQPAGENGTFFQTFPISYTNLSAAPQLTVSLPGGRFAHTYQPFADFSPVIHDYAGAGTASGPVVWMDQCRHEDFGQINVVEKVVLCRPAADRDSLLQANREALENGASGLLLLTYADDRPPDMGDHYTQSWVPAAIPALRVYPSVIDDLFLESGTTITETLLAEDPLPLAAETQFSVATLGNKACPLVGQNLGCSGRNVLGVIPGRDPDFAHEVVFIGAHYDHLGSVPTGESEPLIWAGANDNASGMAVILEIARDWQEAGYVPRRTAVFAAWDAEELGLLGSLYYNQNPQYPPDNVIASLNLDMVGSGGDVLTVDGQQDLVAAISDAAEDINYPLQQINLGRSDHVSFLQEGIPAALIIWLDKEGNTPDHYHRPADTAAVIDLDKLDTVGQIASQTILNLVESEPAITAMLQNRAEAALNLDQQAFLNTSIDTEQAVDAHWFADLQAHQPLSVTIKTEDLRISGNSATSVAEIRAAYTLSGTEQLAMGSLPVRFERGSNGWQWAGPDLDEVSAEGVTVRYPAALEDDLASLPGALREQYIAISGALEMETQVPFTVELFPNPASLQAATSLFLADDQRSWVGPGLVRLVYTNEISPTAVSCHDNDQDCVTNSLVRLALANEGVTKESAPWLWDGLPLAWQAETDSIDIQATQIPVLQWALNNNQTIPSQTAAWAATTYALEQVGWAGLLNWSNSDPWQDAWRDRLANAQTDLDDLMQKRTQAVLAQDLSTFLETVAPEINGAQKRWLADLQANPLTSFSQSAVPLAFLDDGSLLAQVTMTYELSGGNPATAEMVIHFIPGPEGYLWAGKRLHELQGESAVVRYPDGYENTAAEKLAQLDNWIPQLADTLALSPTLPLEVELYDGPDDMRAAIALPYPAVNWTEPGQPIKLRAKSADNALFTQLTRNLLAQAGVDEEWLLRGIPANLSPRFGAGTTQAALAANWSQIIEAMANNSLFPLHTITPELGLSIQENTLADLQSWDAVRFFIQTQGWPELVQQMSSPDKLASAEFQDAWRSSLSLAHIHPQWIDQSAAFSAPNALNTIEQLASPELEGRLAGTAGAQAAAALIADGFRAAGLQPAGDDGTFFQSFPITTSTAIDLPQFAITNPAGEPVSFSYRDDFLSLRPAIESQPVNSDLYFMNGNADYGSFDFNGAIVVRTPTLPIDKEILLAEEHGAAALILTGFKMDDADLYDKQPLSSMPTAAIPVLELTANGFTRFLQEFGIKTTEIKSLLPIEHLDGTAAAYFSVAEPEQTTSRNVLGFLPGSDPFLSQEIILVGAHYDYVGDDANGRRFGGANDASGAAALLEIARLWQEIGYKPQRSILFAAWGAQELGNLGSHYYLQNPAKPIDQTISLIEIEGIAGGDGFDLGAEGRAGQDDWLLESLKTGTDLLAEKLVVTPPTTTSDLSTFDQENFPSILISWRLSGDANLPNDKAYPVKEANLKLSGQAAALLLMGLAQ